ncbi:Cell division protein FtsI [Thiovulum sp. ES]|nr:Cell division protein FtsI [Thiovulum sp. ES]
MKSENKKRANSLVILYMIFLLAILGVTYRYGSLAIGGYDEKQSTSTALKDRAKRGSIITSDGYHVAYTTKTYSIGFKNHELPRENREVFAHMISIYTSLRKDDILRKIENANSNSYVMLSQSLTFKEFHNLEKLSDEFRNLGIMKGYKTRSGNYHFEGLNGRASGSERHYPYGNSATPVIGYTRDKRNSYFKEVVGMKGIEKRFEEFLRPQDDGFISADKDIVGNIIRNSKIKEKNVQNGYDIHLNINLAIQRKVEKALDKYKKELEAKEIIVGVMESGTGKMLVLASSNRFWGGNIKPEEIPFLQVKASEYIFEAGSVLKPIVYSIVLDKNMIKRGQTIDCENGSYKVGRKRITDEHRMRIVPAEEIVIHSSNIGMIKITEALNGIDFNLGLRKFGFGEESGSEVSLENSGSLNTPKQLNSITYKATASFGHGFTVNFIQLLKASNVFNNDGKIVTPKIVAYLKDANGNMSPPDRALHPDGEQVVSVSTSRKMKNILVRTVKEGTGKKTDIDGLEIGGKTGTAHIVKNGSYIREYHSSFFGFANDKEKRYTIGVTVVQPQRNHFASQSAVPVFRNVIELLVEEKYLKKFN